MILLMGIAGSGKGTQGKLLAATRGYHIISTGELLRAYGSPQQHARMHAGEILADEEVTDLLNKALSHLEDQDKVILDGYPRRIGQAEWLLAEAKKDRFNIDYVVHLIASRETVKARLTERGRTDDHDEAIEARFREYEQTTLPILRYLEEQGIKIIEVNAQQSVEDVHREIMAAEASRKDAEKV